MFDAAGVHRSRTRLMHAFSPLASLPRRVSFVVRALRLRSGFRLSAFLRRGDGTWSVNLGIFTAFPPYRVPRVAGERALDRVLSCGPIQCQRGWGVWDGRPILV